MKYLVKSSSDSLILLTVLVGAWIFVGGCNRGSRDHSHPNSPVVGDLKPASAGGSLTQGPTGRVPQSSIEDINVLTYHYDNARTGQNLHESFLTLQNVTPRTFGKIGFIPVKGLVDAEPLYVSNLKIARITRNVLFVVTEHDLAYAFDADSLALLWRRSLLPPGETTSDRRNCGQIIPEIGITATPVIDLKSGPHGTIYIVAMSKDLKRHYFQRLHALDITTGAELPGSPQTIHASFPGTGQGSVGGYVRFDPKQYKERAALLHVGTSIFTTWSSHCDRDPYTAWVISYDQHTLQRTGTLNLTPNGSEGGIWMSGGGPSADSDGNIYLLIGNGTFDTTLDTHGYPIHGDFGNAVVKIRAGNGSLYVADFFTMHDTVAESAADSDLGSGGALLLPDLKDASGTTRHLVAGAGKDQNIYVLDRDSMGKFNPASDQVYQEVPKALGGLELGMPAYFNNTVYYGAYIGYLRAFSIASGRLSASPSSQAPTRFDFPGTTPSISANGISSGIVWAVEKNPDGIGILHAYDAANLANELYNSQKVGARDQFWDNKFITPLIVHGRVYIGTPTGVVVFGLRDAALKTTASSVKLE